MAKCWLCNHEWSAPRTHPEIDITGCPNCGQINHVDEPKEEGRMRDMFERFPSGMTFMHDDGEWSVLLPFELDGNVYLAACDANYPEDGMGIFRANDDGTFEMMTEETEEGQSAWAEWDAIDNMARGTADASDFEAEE